MSRYSEFFLTSAANVIQFEMFEISHPNFTKTYHVVRNTPDGLTVDISPSEMQVYFQYVPVNVEFVGARSDLDSSIRIDFGDVGEILPMEKDAIASAGGMGIKPSVRYWTYQSDNLSIPIYGPIKLEIQTINSTEEGSSFEAQAPSLNSTKTGRRYTLEDFPMIFGFL